MNLSELITYCTLKGCVLEHKKLVAPKLHQHEYYRIKIQGQGYGATIYYAMLDGVIKMSSIQTMLINYMVPDGVQKDVSINRIVEAIIPSN